MVSYAFWITPDRKKVIYVSAHHINVILDNPRLFSFTRKELEDRYNMYGEKLGFEGKAREEIMREALSMGWIRIRRHTGKEVKIEAAGKIEEIKYQLCPWARDMLSGVEIPLPDGGRLLLKETLYTEVVIIPTSGETAKITMKELASQDCGSSSFEYLHDRSL